MVHVFKLSLNRHYIVINIFKRLSLIKHKLVSAEATHFLAAAPGLPGDGGFLALADAVAVAPPPPAPYPHGGAPASLARALATSLGADELPKAWNAGIATLPEDSGDRRLVGVSDECRLVLDTAVGELVGFFVGVFVVVFFSCDGEVMVLALVVGGGDERLVMPRGGGGDEPLVMPHGGGSPQSSSVDRL